MLVCKIEGEAALPVNPSRGEDVDVSMMLLNVGVTASRVHDCTVGATLTPEAMTLLSNGFGYVSSPGIMYLSI